MDHFYALTETVQKLLVKEVKVYPATCTTTHNKYIFNCNLRVKQQKLLPPYYLHNNLYYFTTIPNTKPNQILSITPHRSELA